MPSLGYMSCPHHRAIYTSRYLKRPSRQTSSPISNPRPRMTSNASRLYSSSRLISGSFLSVACGLIISTYHAINVVNYIPTRPLHKAAPAGNMGHRGLPLSLPSPIRHPCEPHHRAYCTALAISVTLPPLSLPSHHPGMKRPSRGIEPPRGSFPSLYRVISRASP